MVAAPSLPAPEADAGEQRIVLRGLTYKDYVLISDVLGHRPGLRLTFLEGTLEIMSPSPLHEHLKTLIARLLELHALMRGVRILGFGSATYRREDAEKGLEPDECYCIDTKKDVPDLAIEVVVTSPGVNKLAVYEGLGVREVWVYEKGRFVVHELGPSGYETRPSSRLIDVDFEVLGAHMAMDDQDDAVRAYWDWLQRTRA